MNNWSNDFQKFMTSNEVQPPIKISSQIVEKIGFDLNPSAWKVFSKMSAIHLVTGTITLMFCPQFGIALFPGMGLMALFMHFGATACMVGCGAVFLGGSTLVSSFVLRPEEIKVIRRTKFLQLSILATLSIGALLCLGADVITTLGLAWVLGSIGGGLASLELGWMIRSWLKKRAYQAT